MKTKFLILLLLITAMANSSTKGQEIIANSGAYEQSANYTLSWTLGEPVVETFGTSNIILTQGFQQTSYNLLEIKALIKDFKIEVYPNPTEDILNIKIINKENSFKKIILFDIQGKILLTKILQNNETELNLSSFACGIYILKIYDSNISKTFKIIKK